jgi:hypothetical protein
MRRLAVCMVACVSALGAAGELPAQQPSPQELWELYPLDPAGPGEGERPATTTGAARPSPSPRSGVAGAVATNPSRAATAEDETDESGAVALALLLGGLAAAIVLLGAAALPQTAAPRVAGVLADRRLEIALAGALTLLVVTGVYLASVL